MCTDDDDSRPKESPPMCNILDYFAKRRQQSSELVEFADTPSDNDEITLRMRGKHETYRIEEVNGGPYGRAFDMTKLADGTVYHCYLSENAQHYSCTCEGACFTGHCKHVDSLYGMWLKGWLPGDEPPDDAAVQSDPVPCEVCGAPVDDPFETVCDPCKPTYEMALAVAAKLRVPVDQITEQLRRGIPIF